MFIVYDYTKEASQYIEQVVVVHTLEALSKLTTTLADTVFIGDVQEQVDNTAYISELRNLLQNVEHVVYARDQSKAIPAIDMVVQSLDGDIYSSTAYLNSYDGLNYLLSGKAKKIIGSEVPISTVVASLKPSLNKGQALILDNAVKDAESTTKLYQHTLGEIATTAVSVITEAQNNYLDLEKHFHDTKDIASSLTKTVTLMRTSGGASSKSLYTYPQITFMPTPGKNFYYLKSAGNVQFLTSAIVGFSDYLSKLGRRPKLLFLVPSSPITVKVLSGIEHSSTVQPITPDKDIQRAAVSSRVVIITHPIQTVVETMLSVDLYSDFIVVDKMGNKEPQVQGIDPILWCADSKAWLDAYDEDEAFFGRAGEHKIQSIDTWGKMSKRERTAYYESQTGLYTALEVGNV